MSPIHRNLTELHRLQAEQLGSAVALRYKHAGVYRDLSWHTYRSQALAAAAALVDAGVAFGDRVGILSENRVEWLIADMAILATGAVTVPPHAPLTAAQVRFQLADAGVSWLFVSGAGQLAKVVQIAMPGLRGIVVFDASAAGGGATSWDEFRQLGSEALQRQKSVLREREARQDHGTLATIIYTSGTTGNPKGVMLTHGNLLSNSVAMMNASPPRPGDVLLSWLPYSHIYARVVDHYVRMCSGTTVVLAESADTVVQNLEEIRPTHLTAVPRFYEKVLAAARTSPVGEARRLREIFGPHIDWLSSGGAPLPLSVAEAYGAAGLLLLQGYGLTETSPVISFNRKDKYKLDTVGPPLEGVEVRIAADGEVLTRGPHVMAGYWNNPAATAETIRDGWLHTGDLGTLDGEGFLKITGRKKELLVLSNGEKVVPAYLEGLILADPCIDQVVVCGEGKSWLTALVVPHWDHVRKELPTEAATLPVVNLAHHEAVYALLKQRIDRALADVSSCEQIRKIHVLEQPLSVANEELTVSLKLRRGVVVKKYDGVLRELYGDKG